LKDLEIFISKHLDTKIRWNADCESGEGIELGMARCEICGKEKKTLFRVSHKERGEIKSAASARSERKGICCPSVAAAAELEEDQWHAIGKSPSPEWLG
jgi:hypothetical protein